MKKIFFILLILLNTLIFSSEIKKILIIDSQSSNPYETLRISMIKELEYLGYKEGKNLEIDYEIAGNYEGRAYNILKSSIKKYDVIFLNGTISSKGALNFLEKRPDTKMQKFLFGNVTDPVGLGLIDEFGKSPKGSFTGIAYPIKVGERLRFIKKIFGDKLKVGYIYSNMPQSISYNKWLKKELQKDEFKDIKFIFRNIDFIKSNQGHRRMVKLAEKYIENLENEVDIFLSANDQLGISGEFAKMVYKKSTKPLVGLSGEKGSTIAIGSDLEKNGKELASMMKKLLDGAKIEDIIPQHSLSKIYKDEYLIKEFGIDLDKLNKK